MKDYAYEFIYLVRLDGRISGHSATIIEAAFHTRPEAIEYIRNLHKSRKAALAEKYGSAATCTFDPVEGKAVAVVATGHGSVDCESVVTIEEVKLFDRD